MMIDANQLVKYYTLSNHNGIEDSTSDHFRPSR